MDILTQNYEQPLSDAKFHILWLVSTTRTKQLKSIIAHCYQCISGLILQSW